MKIVMLLIAVLISTTVFSQPKDSLTLPRPVVEWLLENETISRLLQIENQSYKRENAALKGIVKSDSVRIITYKADSINLIEERSKVDSLFTLKDAEVKELNRVIDKKDWNFWKERILYILIIAVEAYILFL